MKLFNFILITLASFAMAAPALRKTTENKGADLEIHPEQGLGRRFLSKEDPETFNREYKEDGQPPVGRQIQVSAEHAENEFEGAKTLKKPSEDELGEAGGHRENYDDCGACFFIG